MFEERKNLLNNMAQTATGAKAKSSYADRANETSVHIERIRKILLAPEAE
jgi:ferritin-like metal-binding protein YciE